MIDIAKCEGKDCPFKENCYRYTSKGAEYQSYLMEIPYKDGKCDMYWPVKKEKS